MTDNITTLNYQDKEIVLIGTAHVSQKSVELVRETIDEICPDAVCVELDKERYRNMKNPKAWENTNVVDVIRSKKVGLLLANLILGSYQKRVAKNLNTAPGREMMQGIASAKEHGSRLVLADRNLQITFRRIWRKLTLWEKCKLFTGMLFGKEEEVVGEDDLEALMEKDNLEAAIADIGQEFPQIAQVLIHERDQYLAYKIKTAPGKKIVAVLGAAHIPGVSQEINREQDIESITEVPPSSDLVKIFAWAIPVAIVLLIAFGFVNSVQTGVQQLTSWVLWNSVLAAIFTALALGHPLSILTAFVTAPLTSINPFLACGWFAGLVEATVRKPTVRDINSAGEDIFHIRRLFKNRFLKTVMVVVFANVGSSIGTIVAGTAMIRGLLG